MLNESKVSKLRSWFGNTANYHVIKDEEDCSMVLVFDNENYSLARLVKIGDRLDISVDEQVDKLDLDTVGLLIKKCLSLML